MFLLSFFGTFFTDRKVANISKDHGYHRLAALQQACDDEDIEQMEQQDDAAQQRMRADRHHTPIKSPNPQKMKTNTAQMQMKCQILCYYRYSKLDMYI